ncbi:CidA/LrgA family protein [Oceanospirillum sp. HFRX-1_2]
MLFGFLVLLFCQFLGELIVRYLDWPFPGPVVGMVLLLIGLMVNGGVPQGVRDASEGLLTYLALLFVPAGVGLMVHYRLIAADGLVIATALVLSTAVTLLVTGVLLNKLAAKHIEPAEQSTEEKGHG